MDKTILEDRGGVTWALAPAFHSTTTCPPPFGGFMSTRTIAIAALINAVILVIVLFIF